MTEKEKIIEALKEVVSAIQGAPYPPQINNELYTIWYENSIKKAYLALEVINTQDDMKEDEPFIID